MRRRGVAWRAAHGPNRARPSRAGATTVRSYTVLAFKAGTPSLLGSPSPHRRARTAVALCSDLPNPWLRTRTRAHNNHCHAPARCLAVGSTDRRYGTKPGPRTGWKLSISTTRDETAHTLLITGRSTIYILHLYSYYICTFVIGYSYFVFSPSLFWTGADAVSILTMSLTKVGHYSCLHQSQHSLLFNNIAAESTSWFLPYYTCDIRYVSAQDADILKVPVAQTTWE